MSKDPVMENKEFQIYWLTHANADAIFFWLKEQMPSFVYRDDEKIVKTLIDRNEPLIRLGLALYANLSEETALSLFRNGDHTIKKAVLTGTSVGNTPIFGVRFGDFYKVFKEILDSFDEELLRPTLANKNIDDDLLVALYERKEPYDNLTNEQWLKAIAFTVSNPRINTPLDELPPDFYEFGSYQQVFSTGWKLFETLPVNKETAAVLSHLGENLVPSKPHDMDVFATIKRWEVESEVAGDRLFNYYEKCRFVLAKLIAEYSETEFESLKDSDDLALRQSYYHRFRAKKPEEIRNLFKKDNDKFLDVAIYNAKLYRTEDIREELKECCYDYEDPHPESTLYSYSVIFNAQVEKLTKEYPEQFPDFNGDIPFDVFEDPLLQTNKRLEFLQQQTKILSEKLIGSEDQPALIDDMKTAINDVKTDLNESNQQLEGLREDTKILLEKLIGSGYRWESENKHSLIEEINISIENINTILSESNETLSKLTVLGWVMGGVIIVLLIVLISQIS